MKRVTRHLWLRLFGLVGTTVVAAVALGQQANVDQARSQGLLPYLGFCFIGGLISLLTPCVFPIIPVTVSYFSKREAGRALPEALAYSLGIVGTFTVLGIGAALVFGATGIATFTTNPWVNLVLGLIFIALALNLFGLFEFQIPSALARKTDQQRTRGGLVGPFFMGMTFSLTSFTCTAPIAGSLLLSAAKGDLLYPALGMTTYGLAFAGPFFLLALSPSSISKMPRAGDWLNTVKPALAFIELAAAVKFLSNADLGFELGLITRPVFLALWSAIFVGLALYLLGVPKSLKKVGIGRRVLGAGALSVSAVLGLAIAGLPVLGVKAVPLGVVESFPPPDPYPAKTSDKVAQNSAPKITKNPEGRLEAKSYDEALALAKETGRTIFVDFTGVTCINCRLMEKHVFPEAPVKAAMDKMIYVQLYTDRPTESDAQNKVLQDKLAHNIALPTYVLVTPEGKVIDKYEGLSPTVEEFVGFLKKAAS
ncbi:MAG: thioredoxin family protein [Armatimonadetes bacterium]|nr:thioredoxin family protein [Armatimonadota bacterium]